MSVSVSIESIRYKPFPQAKRYRDIGWLPRLNVRKAYGVGNEVIVLRNALATQIGWDAQYPAIAEAITEEEADELVAHWEAEHQQLKDMIADTAKKLESQQIPDEGGRTFTVTGREFLMAKLACMEYERLDAKGEFRRPKVIGTTGNRRGSIVFDAMACQLLQARREAGDEKLQPKDVEDRLTTHITVIVPDAPNNRFPDTAVRMQAQVRENETKELGFKRMTDTERLEATRELVENHGKGQSDIRNCYKPVLGLRLYFAVVIDIYCRQMAADAPDDSQERKEWKNIRFLERLLTPQYKTEEDKAASRQDPMYLDFGKFQQKSFQGDMAAKPPVLPMGLMCEVGPKFDRENKRRAGLKTGQSPLTRPTPEMVQEWIYQQVSGGSSRAKPQMKREQLQTLSGSHPNPFVKDALKAVDGADDTLLALAKARAGVCQYVYSRDPEMYAIMNVACTALRDLPVGQQLVLWTEFLGAVKEEVAKLPAAPVQASVQAEEVVEDEEEVEEEEVDA